MGAISKAWVAIADADVDADSPGDNTLVEGIRDDLVHLREWLGHTYTGNAVQDHDHDSVNSAPLASPYTIFTFRVQDADAWNKSLYTGWVSVFSTSCYFGLGLDTARMAFRYAASGAGSVSVRLVIDGTNYAFDTGLTSSGFTWVNSAITADISAMAARPKWATVTFQATNAGGSAFLDLSGLNVTLTA
jgi:hypothetical protein